MNTEFESRRDRNESRYDLTEVEMMRRTNALLNERPPTCDDRIVCYEINDALSRDRSFSDIGRTLELEVFRVFENTYEDMLKLYGSADADRRSEFFLAIDQLGQYPAGVLRMIRASETGDWAGGLPTLDALKRMFVDAPEAPGQAAELYRDPSEYIPMLQERYGIEDMSKCWDIATAAVRDEYRATGASALVYRAGLKAAKAAGIRDFFAIIDESAYRGMMKLGFPFEALPGTSWVEFDGSPKSLAVHGYVDEFEKAILAKEQEMIRDGKGALAAKMGAFQTIGAGARDHAIMSSREQSIGVASYGYAA